MANSTRIEYLGNDFFFWGGGGSILRNIKGRAMRAWTMYTARMKSKRRGEWWTVNGH